MIGGTMLRTLGVALFVFAMLQLGGRNETRLAVWMMLLGIAMIVCGQVLSSLFP